MPHLETLGEVGQAVGRISGGKRAVILQLQQLVHLLGPQRGKHFPQPGALRTTTAAAARVVAHGRRRPCRPCRTGDREALVDNVLQQVAARMASLELQVAQRQAEKYEQARFGDQAPSHWPPGLRGHPGKLPAAQRRLAGAWHLRHHR